jgi:O-antigen ligase
MNESKSVTGARNENRLLFAAAVVIAVISGIFAAVEPLISFGGVCAAVFVILLLWKFEAAFLFTLFLFPFIPRYFGLDFGGWMVLNPHRALLAGLFIVWILKKISTGERIVHKTPLNMVIALFLLFRLFSVLFSMDFNVSLFRFISESLMYFLVYFVAVDTFQTKEKIERAVRYLILAAGMVGILGFVEFLTRTNLYAGLNPARESFPLTASDVLFRTGFQRIEGSFGHPIALGMYLVLILPLALNQFLTASAKRRGVWLSNALIISAAALLTFSRSVWLSLFFILVFFSLRYFKKFMPVVIVILILVFLVTSLFQVTIFNVGEIFQKSISLEEKSEVSTSTASRLYQLKYGLPFVKEKPITGYGIAMAKEASGLWSIDNYYLTLLLESGVFSLLAFLWLYLLIFKNLIAGMRASSEKGTRDLIFSLLVSVLSIAFMLAMVSLTFVFMLWWAVIALGVRLAAAERT